ncbi:hypothetical protein ACS0TY_026182 [Phlomoides rotata]
MENLILLNFLSGSARSSIWYSLVLNCQRRYGYWLHIATIHLQHMSRESRVQQHKECIHPAGDTPPACRLFDAIVSLCVPVIVSDYIELPFEDVINYRKIAIFIDTNIAVKPGQLVKLLRRVDPDEILEFQKELQKEGI